jgi:hypothetical protein
MTHIGWDRTKYLQGQVRSSLDSSHRTLWMGAAAVLGGIWEIVSQSSLPVLPVLCRGTCAAGAAGVAMWMSPGLAAGSLTAPVTQPVSVTSVWSMLAGRHRSEGSRARVRCPWDGGRLLGVPFERFAERSHPAGGVALHGASADPHNGADLGLGQVRVVAEDDRLALPLG